MKLEFLRAESYVRGAFFSTALNFVAQGLGFLTNIAFAYYFGAREVVDLYYYCVSVVMLIAGSLTALDTAALIPEALRLREHEGFESCMNFLNSFFFMFLGITTFISVFLLLHPIGFFTSISKYDAAQLVRHTRVVYWAVALLVPTLLSQYILDILMAFKFFTLPTLFAVLSRVLVLAAVMLFHDRLSVVSSLAGTMLANVLLIAGTWVFMKKTLNWRFGFRLTCVSRKILGYIGFCVVGQIGSSLSAYAPYFLLGGAVTGVVAAMNYASRVTMALNTVVTSQVSSIVGIKLSEEHARRDWTALNNSLTRTGEVIGFLLIPICVAMCIFAREIVVVFFQRGSFDADSTTQTALFLRYFALNIPLAAQSSIIARLFMASQRMNVSFIYQLGMNALLIAMMAAGVRWLGVVGYPLAQIFVGVLNLILLIFITRRLYPFYNYISTLKYLVRISFVCAVVAVPAEIVRRLTSDFGAWISLLAGGGLFAVLWLCVNRWRPMNPEIIGAIETRFARLLMRSR